MMKTKTQILNEGRYDSLVRTISNDVLNEIKVSAENNESSFDDIVGEYEHESGALIPVVLELYRYINEKTWFKFIVNSFIDYDDNLVVRVFINVDYEPQVYENLYYKINEDVRHEVEHYLQDIFPDRQQPDIPNTSDYETIFAHHIDPSEVEALVHGFYRRAKLEKRPLDEVMLEDIQKDIQDGNLTPDEGDKLLNTWVSYAIKKLPQAQYSNSFRRKFIIQK